MRGTSKRAALRRLGLVAASALTATGVMLGTAAVVQGAVQANERNAPAAGNKQINIDLGPAGDEAVAACLGDGFAESPDQVTVLYGVQQLTRTGSGPSLLLQNEAGDYRMCDMFGATAPSGQPVKLATDKKPVSYLTNNIQSWNCDGTVLQDFEMSQWLSVSSKVDRVQLRFSVQGKAQPWFTTKASDGVVHMQAWLDGPIGKTHKISMQQRVLDSSGKVVKQSAIPTGQQKLANCKTGSVVIG